MARRLTAKGKEQAFSVSGSWGEGSHLTTPISWGVGSRCQRATPSSIGLEPCLEGKAGELAAEQMLTNPLAISLELRVASINTPRSI